jgi:hypothetical protein
MKNKNQKQNKLTADRRMNDIHGSGREAYQRLKYVSCSQHFNLLQRHSFLSLVLSVKLLAPHGEKESVRYELERP